jgi:hypothetical protein
VANKAAQGGGIANVPREQVACRNTLVANNNASTNSDVDGVFSSEGHNLVGRAQVSNGFVAPGDQAGTPDVPLNPKIGPLQGNGGLTKTHALLAGSPAIDAGDNAVLAPPWSLSSDQRGDGRRKGFAVDIGAYESDFQRDDSVTYTLSCHRLDANAVDLSLPATIDTPLIPLTGKLALENSPLLGLGLVADGVTPALIKFTHKPLVQTAYEVTCSVDGTLTDFGNSLNILHNTFWLATNEVVLSPTNWNGFAYLSGIPAEAVQFSRFVSELIVTVKVKERGGISEVASTSFRIATTAYRACSWI